MESDNKNVLHCMNLNVDYTHSQPDRKKEAVFTINSPTIAERLKRWARIMDK